MMGVDSSMMSGGFGGTMMFFGWLTYLVFIVLMAFGIAALWKYLNK